MKRNRNLVQKLKDQRSRRPAPDTLVRIKDVTDEVLPKQRRRSPAKSDTEKAEAHERRLAASREYKRKHRDEVLAWQKAHNAAILADPEKHAKRLQQDRDSAKRNYEKRRTYDKARDKTKVLARNLVRTHIARGKLHRQPCEVCGALAHAHHEDYSRPLEVRWLCAVHHAKEHRHVENA
jgi:RecA-family ATPase